MGRPDEKVQRESFNSLVDAGVYGDNFDHKPPLKRFVSKVLQECVFGTAHNNMMRVLDCGCGTGAWLAFLIEQFDSADIAADYSGFDLSDRMVTLARKNLESKVAPDQIRQGDLLNNESYFQDTVENGFDVVFAFDTVQQLPAKLQFKVLELMVSKLAPGGTLLVFDHDRDSAYGKSMGRKKFITRYFRIPLVPRYYCNAQYPPLAEFAKRLADRSDIIATMRSAEDSPKMALIAQLSSGC